MLGLAAKQHMTKAQNKIATSCLSWLGASAAAVVASSGARGSAARGSGSGCGTSRSLQQGSNQQPSRGVRARRSRSSSGLVAPGGFGGRSGSQELGISFSITYPRIFNLGTRFFYGGKDVTPLVLL
jgi:hypothetical protein